MKLIKAITLFKMPNLKTEPAPDFSPVEDNPLEDLSDDTVDLLDPRTVCGGAYGFCPGEESPYLDGIPHPFPYTDMF